MGSPSVRWLLPTSSAFATVGVAFLAASWVGPACQTACQGDFDCLGSGYCDQVTGRCQRDCFTDEDCRTPPECRENPAACTPLGLFCSGSGRCGGTVSVDFEGDVTDAPNNAPSTIEGWEAPPGTGYAYIVNSIALADRDRGFDIDGQCNSDGCVDNILWPIGDLANDEIRQGLLGGESLLLIELAGLDDDPYTGFDESFTVKIYGANDADEPFFPANNFSIPPGHRSCCQFVISPSSLNSPPPQARARAPALLDRGRIRSLVPVPIRFTLTVGREPHPVVRFENILMTGRIGRGLATIEDGLFGGALPVSTLYSIDNPYCRQPNPQCQSILDAPTLLDLVVNFLGPQPDIDLDGDGRECLFDTDGDGTVDRCCDGRGRGTECNLTTLECGGSDVAAAIPDDPSSCALPPEIDDGYSVAIEFSAQEARIAGTGN